MSLKIFHIIHIVASFREGDEDAMPLFSMSWEMLVKL